MRKSNRKSPRFAIGLDLGDRVSHVVGVDSDGEAGPVHKVQTKLSSLEEFFSEVPKGTRVVMEAGTHSPWVSALLERLEMDVIVANPNQAGRAILANGGKTDKLDATLLASFGISAPQLLRPIQHRSLEAQQHLSIIRARDGLVGMRTQAINMTRGLVKSTGNRLPSCSADAFAHTVRNAIPDGLKPALLPVLKTIEHLTKQIRRYDKKIEALCKHYEETELLQAIPGVGPITALAFVLTLEDPRRFKRSRSVGAFVGLVARSHESGASSPQLRITKAGDKYLRRLLVGAAQYIMSSNGPDGDLQRFGLRLAARGGKRGKKQAVVAVARKLAVLMHRLWSRGEVYDPFFNAKRKKQRAA